MRRVILASTAALLLVSPAVVAAGAEAPEDVPDGVSSGTDADGRPTRDVCLRVTAIESLTTKQVADHVIGGTADVVGPGERCFEEPVPTVATPRDDLEEVREVGWRRIEIGPDGRTLEVHYLDGVPECYGLDRVEVSTNKAGLDVKVFTGRIPGVEFCNLPLLAWMTTVELDAPVVAGGQVDQGQVDPGHS